MHLHGLYCDEERLRYLRIRRAGSRPLDDPTLARSQSVDTTERLAAYADARRGELFARTFTYRDSAASVRSGDRFSERRP